MKRSEIKKAQRWVIKVGSSLVTESGQGLNSNLIRQWSDQVKDLRTEGIEIIWVSSGSVAAGMQRLSWQKRPNSLHELQVAAAVGQASLIRCYEDTFARHSITTAQVLLTHADFENRQRYLNACATFRSMLELKLLPIVNENDTVAVDEIRFGDNDSLAAMVADLIDADLLVILTDQKGLYDANPRDNSSANFISIAKAGDEKLMAYASGGGELGMGGMLTKLKAARIASRTGASTVIANGRLDSVLQSIYAGSEVGTLLVSDQNNIGARKKWIANQLHVKGQLMLDDGAVRVLKESGKSLLPIGVTHVSGKFERGELVSCIDNEKNEIARGLVNYASSEAQKIIGKKSNNISSILGYIGDFELIHRDNLVLSLI